MILKTRIAICILAAACCLSAQAAAAEVSFSDVMVDPADAMSHLGKVSLAEDENTISLNCDAGEGIKDVYYISVYELGETPKYIVKYMGPVNIADLKISGLEGGKEYNVRISSLTGRRTVSGTLTTSYEEVE